MTDEDLEKFEAAAKEYGYIMNQLKRELGEQA